MSALLGLGVVHGSTFAAMSVSRMEKAEEGVALSWGQLGVEEDFTLTGPVAETTVYLPIAMGLRPVALEGQLWMAPDVVTGVLEVYVQEHLLWTERLQPIEGPSTVRIPIPDEVYSAEMAFLPVSFRVRLQTDDPDMMCNPRAIGAWMRWQKGRLWVTDEAVDTPSIAAFFRKGVTQWVLVLPDELTPVEAETALQWTTLLRATQGAGVDIHVLPEGQWESWVAQHALPSPWLRRVVHLKLADTAQATLQTDAPSGPALRIQGRAHDLAAWTALLRQGWAPVLPVQRTGPLVFQAPQEVEAQRLSLATWGHPMHVSGYGRLELHFPFTQADLGAEISAAGARLVGRYTPLPAGYLAVLSVWFNGALVQSVPLSSKGVLDLFVAFPVSRLQRANEMTVVIEYTTPELCVESLPFQLWLDEASFLWFEEGATPNARGFQRFPQVFYPQLGVALEPLNWEHLQAAALLVDAMQRTTWRPLQPRLVTRAQALRSATPLLVVGRDAAPWGIPASVRPLAVRISGRGGLEVEIDEPAALLLPTEDATARPVLFLLAPRGADALNLARGIQDYFGGWFGLQGEVMLYAEPDRWAELPVSPWRPETSLPPSLLQWWHQYRVRIGFAVVVILAVALVWLYQRWVRARPVVPETAGTEAKAKTAPQEDGS